MPDRFRNHLPIFAATTASPFLPILSRRFGDVIS
jgi:hypothetical protein